MSWLKCYRINIVTIDFRGDKYDYHFVVLLAYFYINTFQNSTFNGNVNLPIFGELLRLTCSLEIFYTKIKYNNNNNNDVKIMINNFENVAHH